MHIKVRYLTRRLGTNGRIRWFWQPSTALRSIGWPLTRLADDEVEAIADAERLNRELDTWRLANGSIDGIAIRPGTLGAVIASYKASRHYRDLRASTRRTYDWCLAILADWSGDVPVRAITPKRVATFYEAMAKTRRGKANGVLRILSVVMEHARREDLIEINPQSERLSFSIHGSASVKAM